MAISPLLVWSEGEPLESAVSNLPWFMVCLFHETRKKKKVRGGGVPVIPANKRGAGCFCSGLILFSCVCSGERYARSASEINCFFMASWSLKEKEKKIFGQSSLKNRKMSVKLYFPAQRSLFHIWNSISGFGGCRDKRATWEHLDLAAETQTICAHTAVLQIHKWRKSLAASIIHPETSGKL